MLRPLPFSLATLCAAATLAGPVSADDRYVERPPVVLSANAIEPWTAQLRPSYRDVTGPVTFAPFRAGAPAVVHFSAGSAIMPAAPREAPVRQAALAAAPDEHAIEPRLLPTEVDYHGREAPGTVVIDTGERYLYLVEAGGKARRYGVGVGRPGFQWAGVHTVTRKAEWPDWTPPPAMLKRKPDLPRHMDGGPDNPLGARALYLGSTEYRIHGSNEPWTIGKAVSSGCIRMRNEDVTDLYRRVPVGTRVMVL
ncbi:L,D-transpeptidase [Siculibacillus lacustris]|uniref:L,D-transpeptidase n=1 Tax=Siculibacillus lacustris TaxID=1549641 RepID=A0A4Q9VNG2_9HYPH|nr:L,D-transpeptidase [Siculibacillus lacustris]TBW37216.1 L,D-transpeptidase [Siculibacillus lacustris]